MKLEKRSPRLTDQDMAGLGMGHVAYVRTVVTNDVKSFAIHTADGNEVTRVPSFEIACVVIRQNDLEPVRVH